MSSLTSLEGIVRDVLEHSHKARNNDHYCYILVASKVLGKNVMNHTMCEVLLDPSAPRFESVRRTRQKVQSKRPDLWSDREVAKLRREQELKYQAYARKE